MRTTVSVTAAADLLDVSRAHGYALARSGELPGVVRLGGTYRVSVHALATALGMTPEAVLAAVDSTTEIVAV